MNPFLRQLFSLGVALALTWWLLFRAPAPAHAAGVPAPVGPVSIEPVVENAIDVSELVTGAPPEAPAVNRSETVSEAQEAVTAPPPPEAGSRDGSPDAEAHEAVPVLEHDSEVAAAVDEAAPAEEGPARTDAAQLAADRSLLVAAEKELAGEVALGFATVLVSSPEDQLDIARAFSEEIVLVPRAALDPEAAGVVSYRLDLTATPRVVEVPGRPPLERYRQYRDLFSYDFERLPRPLRTLRSSVVRRDEVFLFAALIPAREWAVVVGRRQEAVRSLGLQDSDVERFVLRYIRLANGSFDLAVDEVHHVDGRRLVPSFSNPQFSARTGRAPNR
jgi:hypothetical protein